MSPRFPGGPGWRICICHRAMYLVLFFLKKNLLIFTYICTFNRKSPIYGRLYVLDWAVWRWKTPARCWEFIVARSMCMSNLADDFHRHCTSLIGESMYICRPSDGAKYHMTALCRWIYVPILTVRRLAISHGKCVFSVGESMFISGSSKIDIIIRKCVPSRKFARVHAVWRLTSPFGQTWYLCPMWSDNWS